MYRDLKRKELLGENSNIINIEDSRIDNLNSHLDNYINQGNAALQDLQTQHDKLKVNLLM